MSPKDTSDIAVLKERADRSRDDLNRVLNALEKTADVQAKIQLDLAHDHEKYERMNLNIELLQKSMDDFQVQVNKHLDVIQSQQITMKKTLKWFKTWPGFFIASVIFAIISFLISLITGTSSSETRTLLIDILNIMDAK